MRPRLDGLMSTILLGGVIASGLLMTMALVGATLVGWQGSLVNAGPATHDPTDFGGLLHSLVVLRPIALAKLGLVVLVGTPVLRVSASAFAFALDGDGVYAVVSSAVLVILLVSLFGLR